MTSRTITWPAFTSKAIALFLIALILSACNKKEKQVVQIGLLNGPSSISMVHAIQKDGYFNEKAVDYIIKDNPQHLRALIMSEHMDMAILPMTMAYSMIDNDIDIKIFAITSWGNLYLLGRQEVTDLSELAGKTISVPGEGQTPDLVTNFLLDYQNVNDKVDINYTYPAPLLLASALAVGKIDYAVLPEPLASLALSKDTSIHRCIDLGGVWDNAFPDIPLVQSVFVIRTPFYEQNRDWFTAYAKELKIKVDYTLEHPDETIALAQKYELLPPNLPAKNIIANSHLDFVRDASIATDITSYLKTFYVLEDNFDMHSYLIIE